MNDPQFTVGRYINHIAKDIHLYHRHHLKEFDMGWGQFKIILLLMKEDGLKQEKISCQLEIDKTTVTRTLKKLEASGFIKKVHDPHDKRIQRIYLTPESIKHKEFLTELRGTINEKLLVGFSDNEIELLTEFLIRLKENSHILLEEKTNESI